ncbi:hypothetical protein Tsubulata_014586, partial [Turnera subulata]
SEHTTLYTEELSVSVGYHCNVTSPGTLTVTPDGFTFSGDTTIQSSGMKMSSSFSCLSGAALGANATLANTNTCNDLIGEEILPSLILQHRLEGWHLLLHFHAWTLHHHPHSSLTTLGGSTPIDIDFVETERNIWKSASAPLRTESSSFLNAMDVQMAGGAAGEDRVQAVCSEGNGWLFCRIYDGFNGRDAADFLEGTLHDNICFYLHMLELRTKKLHDSYKTVSEVDNIDRNMLLANGTRSSPLDEESKYKSSPSDIVDCLLRALRQANDFIRAILLLATKDIQEETVLKAFQLTETHNVDDEAELRNFFADLPDDPSPTINGRGKGKLMLSRAFGVGCLKKSNLNDALMGNLQVQNLCSPPYIYSDPFSTCHSVSENDQLLVLPVHRFILQNPSGDPAKHLIEQLVHRTADSAGDFHSFLLL